MQIVPEVIQKFSTFYGTWFVTTFTKAGHLPVPSARSTQSTHSHHVPWTVILILFSHLCVWGIQSGLFLTGLPNKTLAAPLLPTFVHVLPISFVLISPHRRYLVRSTDHEACHYEVSCTSCYLLFIRPKYPHLHPILMFFPHCDRIRWTPIQTSGKVTVLY
jgi:hypothetical protein